MSNGYDPFADIDQWGQDVKPQQAFRPGPEALPEGIYHLKVTGAELATVKDDRVVFRLSLAVVGGPYDGVEIDYTTFLDSQGRLDRLAGDLLTCGLTDVPQWGKRGKPWSQELRDGCGRLAGRKIIGHRKNNTGDNGKTYSNLNIVGASTGATAAPMPHSAPASAPAGVGNGNEVPF